MFVIIGTANVDLLVSGFARMPVVMGDEFTTSSLVFCDEALQLVLGGNGANCAYALAGLGAQAALCSAVGDDELGRMVRRWLAARPMLLDGLVNDSAHATAYTAIVADRARNRLAFHHPGALAQFAYTDIPQVVLGAAEVLLVTSYTILPQLRASGFAQALRAVRQRGALTAVDIGPAIGEPAKVAELAPLLPDVDYLIANRHELAVCTGVDQVGEAALALVRAGARCVIVKLGSDGAAIFGKETRDAGVRDVVSLRSDSPGFCLHIPAFAVPVHVTVGAGDSFNAGLLYGLRAGWPLAEAVRFGNAVAALVVAGAQGILDSPSLAQVQEFLQKQAV